MSKSNIDDIWASMNEEVAPKKLPDFEKMHKTKKTAKKKQDMNDPLKILGTKKEKKEVVDVAAHSNVTVSDPVEITLSELQPKLNKEINALSDSNHIIRKNGLQNLYRILFSEYRMSERDYSELFHDICRPLFKRFADSVEKCRELAHHLTKAFFERSLDIVPVLAYYFPALMQRIPSDLGYDEEMKVFVIDKEAHNAYKRGKAVERQDKAGAISGQSTIVVESSEEIRFLQCDALLALLQRVQILGSFPILHPYFEEIIIFLQLQLRDPYPELKSVACQAFEMLARVPDYEVGMKYYSVAICRSILPVLRHRHAKVRTAAVAAIHQVMIVPDRAKRKGSGTEAIQDMVGFREENILPIAAFYKDDVQVNYLAELVGDKSPQVREKLVEFLSSLLTVIDDRYDHQTRLLPYLLDLMTDEVPSIANNAYRCLQVCGKEYEEEHHDEILEKRQYGVDGNDKINLDKPLPSPFTERPRIGMRMYVRGNSKRFLLALVNELTSWMASTRLKSGHLLKLVIVLCEEHTTMEMHTMLPQLMKALKFARDDKDTDLQAVLRDVFELLGRYILPEIYLYYILPRLRGDPDVQPFGVDAETRVTAMEMLSALLEGSKANTIVPFFQELVQTLTDPFVISPESVKQQSAAMRVLSTVLSVLHGKSKQAIEAFYVATGRITSLQVTIRQIFRYLLLQISTKDLREQAWQVLILLSQLETDPVALHQKPVVSVARLFYVHGTTILQDEINRYDIDAAWSKDLPEHQVISRLLEYPAFVLHQDMRAVRMLLGFIFESVRSLRQLPAGNVGEQPKSGTMVIQEKPGAAMGGLSVELENDIALAMNDLLLLLLTPFIFVHHVDDWRHYEFNECFAGIIHTASHSKGADRTLSSGDENVLGTLFSETMMTRMHTVQSTLQNVQTETLLEELIQVMVVSPRWSRHPALNQSRLKLLFLLLGKRQMLPMEEDGMQEGMVLLQSSLLMRYMSTIVNNVCTISLVPATLEPFRMSVIHLVSAILDSLQEFSGLKKVMSTTKVAAKLTEEETSSPASVFAFSRRLHYFETKGCAQTSLYHCLQALDDASDHVRELAIRTVLANVQFFFGNAEEVDEWKNRLLPDTSLINMVEKHLTFDAVVASLFHRCMLELNKLSGSQTAIVDREATQSFVNLLDTTLRMICVIHPNRFEQIIRAESASFLTQELQVSAVVQEFINGLVNHADILLSMP